MYRRAIYLKACILYALHMPWFDRYMSKLSIGAGDPDTLHDILNL